MNRIATLGSVVALSFFALDSAAQCSTTNGTSCQCEVPGQTDCDLLPDMTVSWYALENYASGPSEYSQSGNGANDGRLRVTGSTPNIGHGTLNVRGVDQNGYRWFICGTDTFNIYDPSNNQQFSCPNSQTAQQLILQRVYHKDGSSMSYTERFAGTMTYHPSHGHNHVDDWVTFTLRIEDPNDPNPLNWSIVGTGAKVGFCLMDYFSCAQSSAAEHCRTSQEYGGGTALNNQGDFENYGHGGGNYGCSPISQGISVGYTDVYSESLDGMWVNVPPGTCNGDYWIVIEVDPNDNFLEEDETNNWTAIPFTLTQQVAAGNFTATLTADGDLQFCGGEDIEVTATAGSNYLWSTGETTQSITISQAGDYHCEVTSTCGVGQSDTISVNVMDPLAPTTTGAVIPTPGSAMLSATGTNVEWYDDVVAGSNLGSGNNFNTPSVSATTSFWADDREIAPGSSGYGGKSDNSGSGAYFNNNQSLIFDADVPFTLKSVKMYVNSAGTRHILMTTDAGDLIDELIIFLNPGEQRVTLNFQVPAGSDHEITVWDDNTGTSTLVRDIYRNNGGVSYPYDLNGYGEITTSTAGGSYYYFYYDWEVEQPDVVCVSPRAEAVLTVDNSVYVSAKVFLDGPFDDVSGLMNDDLRSQGIIPAAEPFTAGGYVFVGDGGGEAIDANVLAVSGSDAIVDWVMMELRDKNDPTSILNSRAALVQRDGDIVDMDGVSPVVFGSPWDLYYVVVKHRNHLGIMSDVAVSLNTTPGLLDFTDPAQNCWGTGARHVDAGYARLWSGDVSPDGTVKYIGSGNDRDNVLLAVGGSVPTATTAGYLLEDVNMDGVVKYTGSANDRDRILLTIGGQVPTATKQEQMP